MMLFRFIDKLIFAAMLLAGLQVPQLAEHYRQYLQGYFDATAEQVDGYERNAMQNGYSSVDAMIEEHLRNATPSVRTDAEQKQQTLVTFEELSRGIAVFDSGNLLEKSAWMFNPAHNEMLKATMVNFEPGIPLNPTAFIFAIVVALLSNMLVASPVYVYRWRQHRKMAFRYKKGRQRAPDQPPGKAGA